MTSTSTSAVSASAAIAGEDSELARATMRRVTLRVAVFLMACYFVAYLDRVNVGFAALTMNKDLGLSAYVYGWGAGIFFIGYFLFGVPSNIIMEKVGARLVIAVLMVSWGIASMGMAFITGPWSFYIVRFLIGVAEAGFFPGVILFLTTWLPRQHRARIVSIFAVASPISSFLGSPVSGALLMLDDVMGLHGWQWLFLLEAAPAVIMGGVIFFFLPNRPSEAMWLTAEQRDWLVAQLETERRERSTTAGPTPEWWRIITQPHVLLLGLVYLGSAISTYGLSLWLPQIIFGFGLNTLETGLVAALPWGLSAVIMIWWGHRSDRARERVWHTSITLMATAVGLSLGSFFIGISPVMVMVFLSLAAVGAQSIKGPFWVLCTEKLPPTYAAASIAFINAIGNLGGFIGPFSIGWIKDSTGSFSLTMLPLIALALIGAVVVVVMHRTPAPGEPVSAKAA